MYIYIYIYTIKERDRERERERERKRERESFVATPIIIKVNLARFSTNKIIRITIPCRESVGLNTDLNDKKIQITSVRPS